jgi:peptidoglycan/xylan/chitin deacetylase (PgdA/CDA1 family)
LAILLLFLIILSFVYSSVDESLCAPVNSCPIFSRADTNEHLIALTFDDGPHDTNTERVLDLLSQEEIKATFFVVGENAQSHPEIIERIIEEGHELGNHTYKHTYLGGKNKHLIEREIDLCDDAIFNHCEYSSKLLRPPGGIYDPIVSSVCAERGYTMVLWSIDTRDWSGADAKSIEMTIMDNIEDGAIILCHDFTSFKSNTVEALRVVIPKLKKLGYRFVTVSELIG